MSERTLFRHFRPSSDAGELAALHARLSQLATLLPDVDRLEGILLKLGLWGQPPKM